MPDTDDTPARDTVRPAYAFRPARLNRPQLRPTLLAVAYARQSPAIPLPAGNAVGRPLVVGLPFRPDDTLNGVITPNTARPCHNVAP